jgi:hypothetical protein
VTLPDRRRPTARAPACACASRTEWLVAYGGSEKCVEEMLAVFPDAVLLTTLVSPDAVPSRLAAARPSFLQRIPGATGHHEWLLRSCRSPGGPAALRPGWTP